MQELRFGCRKFLCRNIAAEVQNRAFLEKSQGDSGKGELRREKERNARVVKSIESKTEDGARTKLVAAQFQIGFNSSTLLCTYFNLCPKKDDSTPMLHDKQTFHRKSIS